MRLTIYSRPGCHLCDQMKSLVLRIISAQPNAQEFSVDEIDISGDRELLDRYGLEIPVLVIDGKKVAKYRVSETALTQILQARRQGGGGRGEG